MTGLGMFPGRGHGNPLQYSCLENPHGLRRLAGYCLWGPKESDTINWLSTARHSTYNSVQFSCSVISDSLPSQTVACQASQSSTNSRRLLKLMYIESVMPSNNLILFHPLLLMPSIFFSIRSFPLSQFFVSGGQSIGTSASASVLPMNIQDLFPLGVTGWIPLLSKGLSRVFSNTTAQNHNSLAFSFLYGPALTSIYDYWKNHSFD